MHVSECITSFSAKLVFYKAKIIYFFRLAVVQSYASKMKFWHNLQCIGMVRQEILRGRNCCLSTQTPNYQFGWAVLAASRLLDTLKRNFQKICRRLEFRHNVIIWLYDGTTDKKLDCLSLRILGFMKKHWCQKRAIQRNLEKVFIPKSQLRAFLDNRNSPHQEHSGAKSFMNPG